MPKFAANLTMLFTELPFLDRFEAAMQAGFKGVEFLFPYAHEIDPLVSRLRRFGLTQVLHNLPAGDWDKGERGVACLPDRVDEFRAGVDEAIRYATALHCRQVNCLVGVAPPDADPRLLTAILVDNLRYAAGRLGEHGIRLLVEPLNTFDAPGYVLTGTLHARRLIERVGSDNVAIQYDAYHMQIMEGDLARTVRNNLDRIGHVQVADNPGRHEPGTGEINYDFFFAELDRAGYAGWVGCEYKPAAGTQDGLDWLDRYRAPARAFA